MLSPARDGQYLTEEELVSTTIVLLNAGHEATVHQIGNAVNVILKNGADPNVREQGGYTPLHAAAQNGDLAVIRTLIYGGADLEARSHDGKTPLDLALEADHLEAAKLLQEGITRRFKSRRE